MRPTIVIVVLAAVSACGETPTAECTKDVQCKGTRICVDGECVEPGAADRAVADLAVADLAAVDLVIPDLATPDLAGPDLAALDLSTPDLATPDLAVRDLATPDLATPDLATPDLARPDLATPDLTTPDLAMPDLATPDLTPAPTCTDQKKNGQETDVDCGGGTCPGCANGKSCLADADCASGTCALKRCVTPLTLSFASPRTFASATSGPQMVAITDFEKNGKADIVVVGGSVGVLLGTGGGSFGTAVAYASGCRALSVAVADLDKNGVPDVVTGNYGGGNPCNVASVLLGKSDGTLGAHVDYKVGIGDSQPHWVGIGDFNGDGAVDVLASSGIGGSWILRGNGDGTLPAGGIQIAGNTTSSYAVRDLNGDGRPDIVFLDGSYQLRASMNDGNGNFATNDGNLFTYSGTHGVGFTLDDFDGDGLLDAAIADGGNNRVQLFRSMATLTSTTAVAGFPLAIDHGDFDADGRPDLVISASSANDLTVLLGKGDGTFGAPIKLALGGARLASSVTVADIDADGKPDIVAPIGTTNEVVIFGNTSN